MISALPLPLLLHSRPSHRLWPPTPHAIADRLSAAGYLAPSTKCIKAGGAFGILTAGIAAYTALAGMLTKDTSHFMIPVGDLTRAKGQN
jgi:hypothetical protein